MSVPIANGPTSWGVDHADGSSNPPWGHVLDGIAAAGYEWLELGPVGYLPEDSEALRSELERRGLRAAGTFLFQPFHDPERLEAILEVARRTCALIEAVGGRYLVIVNHLAPERAAVAGHSAAASRLKPKEWRLMLGTIEAVAQLAQAHGIRSVLHPHAGTYVEFEDEIDTALGALDPALVGLCVDTGHSLYAGIDPAALVLRYRDRVEHLHLKDVDLTIRDRPIGFEAAVAAGVFRPLGEGAVDFAAFRDGLATIGYSGIATVEQDRDPAATGDPVADARASLEYLRRMGIARAEERSVA